MEIRRDAYLRKLKDKSGNRVASLDENGKILGK